MQKNRRKPRKGAVLVLMLVCLISLLTFVALAIDLGMLAVARTQCQDAADSAAMAGARTLNGVSANNSNYSAAGPNAIAAATYNTVLSKAVQSSQVTIQIGRYTYLTANQRFEGQYPGPSTENWSMVNATVSANVGSQLAFSKIFNFTGANITTTAVAAHRPRDVAVILDYSGSMRFASLVGDPYYGDRTSNNGDSVVPTFGHYSSGSAGLQATTFTSPYDAANITTTTSDGRPPICADFYQDGGGTPAFSAASSGYAATPAGDNFLKINKNGGATFCTTPADLLGTTSGTNAQNLAKYDAAFESQGYQAYGMAGSFSGYTQGPGYWGKTFFVWPPDPRAGMDWRGKFFTYPGTATPMDDNSRLWDSSGSWQAPSGSTYAINYAAILSWINSSPAIFPPKLQSGRILYYDQIPSSINTSVFPPADMNQRFWKDYIDYVLGLIQTGSNSWTIINNGSNGLAGYGPDFSWGTVRITPKSNLTQSGGKPYMYYWDNPQRPLTHFWFGPLTMIDFLGNYNVWYSVNPAASRFCWWPGTCHEAPMYACKLGIRAALTDISNNHPNDLVTMAMFSVPDESANDTGRFNRVRVGLSRDYSSMQDSLWYPPATIGNASATVRPYDSNNLEVPRAYGGTCYAMGLMQAYNQFSGNTSLLNYNPGAAAGDAGGNGRKGAQKIIILETDGAPNTTGTAALNNQGANNSYYSIRYNSASPGSSEFPNCNGYNDNDPTVTSQIFNLCTQICAFDTASPPGYSTTTKKAQIHCIGFGPVFAPGGAGQAAALATLNQMQILGNVTDGMPSYKVIYGSQATVVADLQQAFTQILQSGVQISLIQ